MALIPFVCNDCGQFVEGQTREQHRKKCKPIEAPASVPDPKSESIQATEPEQLSSVLENVNITTNGLEDSETVKRRVKQWRENNRKEYNRYMRELMKAKRQKAKQK